MFDSDEHSRAQLMRRAERIAQLNDQLRKTAVGGSIVATRGVRALAAFKPNTLLTALRTFDAFNVSNDPYGEHDCGTFPYAGADILWKIDYYDQSLRYASPDPADPTVTTRVLTVMLCSEY